MTVNEAITFGKIVSGLILFIGTMNVVDWVHHRFWGSADQMTDHTVQSEAWVKP